MPLWYFSYMILFSKGETGWLSSFHPIVVQKDYSRHGNVSNKKQILFPPTAVLRLWKRLFHFSCEITKCINTHAQAHRYNTLQQKVTVVMTITISSIFYWKSFWSVGFNNYMFVTVQHSKTRMSSSQSSLKTLRLLAGLYHVMLLLSDT